MENYFFIFLFKKLIEIQEHFVSPTLIMGQTILTTFGSFGKILFESIFNRFFCSQRLASFLTIFTEILNFLIPFPRTDKFINFIGEFRQRHKGSAYCLHLN